MMRLREDVQEAVRLAHEIAARQVLWPGWDFAATPLALYGDGEGYLIGHPSPPAGYEFACELVGRPVYAGPALPEMMANTATLVGGHLTAMAMLPRGPLETVDPYARLLLHEAFHAFQRSALADPGWTGPQMLAAMGRYPEHDPQNNALAVVENRLLPLPVGWKRSRTGGWCGSG